MKYAFKISRKEPTHAVSFVCYILLTATNSTKLRSPVIKENQWEHAIMRIGLLG
jgi:hypothetical protein